MKIYVILKADYCDYSAQYGCSEVLRIKYRERYAIDMVGNLAKQNDENYYYYEPVDINLRDIPTLFGEHSKALFDVDTFNMNEQMHEDDVKTYCSQIEELKDEVKKLKQSVAHEKTRANHAESIRSKTEQELRTIRNTIRAAKKIDKPKFLGFEDSEGTMYPIDSDNKSCVLVGLDRKISISIGELRKRKGELKPVYAARSEE